MRQSTLSSCLMFKDFSHVGNEKEKIPDNSFKVPKTFREISESRDRKEKFKLKSKNISLTDHKKSSYHTVKTSASTVQSGRK